MVSAIIIAGGSGSRTGQSVPKQFLTVNDIPVIVYTMMNLQKVAQIHKIVVVAAEGWENFIYTYAQQFGVTKLKEVVTGGRTRNESIYNGLCCLKDDGETEKVCLVDANRPLIPESVICNTIALADDCDCSVAAERCYDSMFVVQDGEARDNIDRNILYRGLSPECARLSTMLELYEDKAAIMNTELSTIGLAVRQGKKVLLAEGHIKCFKITTADDFELFKAYLAAEPLNNIV